MKNISRASSQDRQDLFRNTSAKTGMAEAIVEKDFWVCWMLDYLFHDSMWKEHLSFKGGTSLSKAYGLIERFSEDIDLILDWRVLGYGAKEPYRERSNSAMERFKKDMEARAANFLATLFVPAVKRDISSMLGMDVDLRVAPDDPHSVLLRYPQQFTDASITQEICLEIGPLAAWAPAAAKRITPYAAEQYPDLFSRPSTDVLTVLPERTFWEKITILHCEGNRPAGSTVPLRYARHYYDVVRMADSPLKGSFYNSLELLTSVAAFKEKFYRRPWAKYEEAKPGTIKLVPPSHSVDQLRRDYRQMHSMLYGKFLDFDSLMDRIQSIETEINNLSE